MSNPYRRQGRADLSVCPRVGEFNKEIQAGPAEHPSGTDGVPAQEWTRIIGAGLFTE